MLGSESTFCAIHGRCNGRSLRKGREFQLQSSRQLTNKTARRTAECSLRLEELVESCTANNYNSGEESQQIVPETEA
ncbi:Protein of unknown function [Gryllus bimaculatus]|nr:Protein of unknown function [Gryllus bimaculatus]